jgi:hypothetical protein
LEKGDAELLMLGKTQTAMTQPNLSNGESVRCIKKLDMYKYNRPGDLKHVFWTCDLKKCRGNAQGKFK